jgi:hypothetical protein
VKVKFHICQTDIYERIEFYNVTRQHYYIEIILRRADSKLEPITFVYNATVKGPSTYWFNTNLRYRPI